MEPNFTNKELEKMLEECISELEALGYELVPISSIQFTNRNSRYRLGVCKNDKSFCYFNQITRKYEGIPTVYIRITGNLRYLPLEMRSNLKTLVMHETIHAVKAPENISENALIYDFATPHGERYDCIKDKVEKFFGYKHIDDNTYFDGLSEFVMNQYEKNAANARK